MAASLHVFPLYMLTNIPEALRQLANKMEHGEESIVRCVIAIETEAGGADYRVFGAEPFDKFKAIGMCHAAAMAIFNECEDVQET